MTMETCLFCISQFDPQINKPEHILLNAFGGQITVKDAICSDCNIRFGGEIDRPLAEGFELLRNMFCLKKGDGQSAPTIIDRSDDGRQRRLKPGLKANSRTADQVSNYSYDKDGNIHIEIRGHENAIPSMKSDLAEKIAKHEGLLKKDILAAIENIEVQKTSEMENINKIISFNSGGIAGMRSLMKSSILLFARQSVSARSFVQSPSMEQARHFVVDGSEDTQLWCYDHHIPPQEHKLRDKYGPLFNLFVVFNHPRKGLVAYVRIYNIVAMRLQLSRDVFREPSVHLVSNPIDRNWSEGADGIDDLIEWVISNDPKAANVDNNARQHMEQMIMEANQITGANIPIRSKQQSN